MSNHEHNSHFFDGSNQAEAKVREWASSVDENAVLIDYVNSPDAIRYAMDSEKIGKGALLSLYFSNGIGVSCRSIARSKQGLIVKKIDSEDGLLLKGSFYTIDISDINDTVALSVLNGLFSSPNIPCSNSVSLNSSVPIAAAKGQVGIGGYLVYSHMYSPLTVNEMQSNGTLRDFDSLKLVTNTDLEGYYLDDRLEYSPYRIKDLSVIVSPSPKTT
jgi:hypothetical protein